MITSAPREEYQGVLDISPNSPGSDHVLGLIYLQKGRAEEAAAEARRAEELSGDDQETLAMVGGLYGRAGKRDEALRVLNELKERSKREDIQAGVMAIIYAGLGEKDQAFAWLEKSYQQREWVLTHLQIIPPLDPLRDDPRFQNFVRRMNFPP